MSATLTWYNSGLATKTGTTIATFLTDLKTLIDSKSADSNFTWEVSASSLAGTPYYLWLRPKSGAVGRILIISWTSNPAGNNTAILDGTPVTTMLFMAYFPNGNAASPSNLTAASGSISGDDTDCTKVGSVGTTTTIYGANHQCYYFDSAEGIYLCCQNPGTAAAYMGGAGMLVVDANDVAYAASYGSNGTNQTAFGAAANGMVYTATGNQAGVGSTPCIKTSYASQAVVSGSYPSWFPAYTPNGPWGATAIGASDILTDTTNTDAWFVPVPLVMNITKGGGFPIKLRQVAIGPASQGQFTVYNITGPVTAARNISAYTSATAGYPWLVNFKI